ncbi:hypothetical protein CAEBREN_17996 [Caenorhabditis brenneri]|uniref:Uncharacterized protein n=1 Tax=Caenorhabditis brenneri TaxID=135651 RepID=G0NRK0_CAEBE|nr:hypothetical protein CAEBREN_17996 [Caenorhabditis brenneri]
MNSDALAAAAAMTGTGSATGSAGPSRTATPPAPVPAEPASTAPSAPTVASTATTPLTDQAVNVLAQLVKTSKMNRSRTTSLAEKPEVQALLDKDLFLIQSDRRTKMNPIQQLQLIRTLSQFFMERVDDGHRYAYFEAIFLGRADDPILHEYRLSVMYQLVSFSIQYPVLQYINHVMTWLCQMKNEELERNYSDRLLDMIVDHYVRTSNERNEMYKFLQPLRGTSNEFCALFFARAALHAPLNPHMVKLICEYSTTNIEFIHRHLRDTPWLGNDFAQKVVPKLVEYSLTNETHSADVLAWVICYVQFKWEIDVLANDDRKGPTKRVDVLDLLLSTDYPWSKRRCCMLASAISSSTKCEAVIRQQLKRLDVPYDYKPVIERLCAEDLKNNAPRVLESITDMHLAQELQANS